MSDELEAVLTRHLNGNGDDPLRAMLMQGLNPDRNTGEPIALNDDAALTATILNSIKGNQ